MVNIGRPVCRVERILGVPGQSRVFPLRADGTPTGESYLAREIAIVHDPRTGRQIATTPDDMAVALARQSIGPGAEVVGETRMPEDEAKALWDGKARYDLETREVTMEASDGG